MKRILSILLFSGCIFHAAAQKNFTLKIKETGGGNILKKIDYKTSFPSKTAREKELQQVLTTLFNSAYLAARYDSILSDTLAMTAYLNPGAMHKWAKLSKGNVDEGLLSEIGFREKMYRDRPLKYGDVAKLHEKILNWCDNHGYPFAVVKFDSVRIADGFTMHASLSLVKNLYLKVDSISIKGKVKIAPAYFYNYIGIKPGDPYNEATIQKISARIRELAFLREKQPFQVLFTEKYVKLIFYLEKKRASQFDGIVGILPDKNTGKITFTGDVRLRLQNGFGRGELIDLNWRRLQEQTQDLKARFVYPFILRTPFGIDYGIKLYRKDTTFIDVQQSFGVQYLFSGGNFLKAFVNTRNSSLLSTKNLENLTVLPPFADINTIAYGLAFRREKLDYRLNPRKGWVMQVSSDIGNRTIRKNARLNPVIYNGIELKSVQYSGEGVIEKFWPVARRGAIKTSAQGAYIFSPTVFTNELYRIGGLRTLRGFDEESIFASSFAIATLEYRFLLEENSYLYFFGDGAWYENRSVGNFATDTPYGFGAGISFETKAGIFSINYALGSQQGNPVSLRSGKVHFGIVGVF
ncbi:MAG: hypothetical protein FD123_4303 [Bacteroidetes bacterium]|nr:MAG: hypothetical protein FD123_4303 [Bacteroidota bacterium]